MHLFIYFFKPDRPFKTISHSVVIITHSYSYIGILSSELLLLLSDMFIKMTTKKSNTYFMLKNRAATQLTV